MLMQHKKKEQGFEKKKKKKKKKRKEKKERMGVSFFADLRIPIYIKYISQIRRIWISFYIFVEAE